MLLWFDGQYLVSDGGLPREQQRQAAHASAGAEGAPHFAGSFGFWSRVVVGAFRLEEDGVLRVPPEVCDGVAAVTAARLHF